MFSIVTANWNGENLLDNFFESLVNQSFKDFRIYIVDNGSTDDSINLIKKYSDKMNINLIELESNLGFAQANNIAIDKAINDKSEYIITLNNDVELDADALLVLFNNIKTLKERYDIYQILLINYYDRNLVDAAGIELNKELIATQVGYKQPVDSIESINCEINGVCAGAGVYSKKSLLAAKDDNGYYFDAAFFAYYEDVDLAIRLNKLGFKSFLIKDAIAYHRHSATSGKNSAFKEYYLSRNFNYYLRKNQSTDEYNSNKPLYLFYYSKKILKFSLKLKIQIVKSIIRGYSDSKKI